MYVKVFLLSLSHGSDKWGKIRFVSTGENHGKPSLVCKKKERCHTFQPWGFGVYTLNLMWIDNLKECSKLTIFFFLLPFEITRKTLDVIAY